MDKVKSQIALLLLGFESGRNFLDTGTRSIFSKCPFYCDLMWQAKAVGVLEHSAFRNSNMKSVPHLFEYLLTFMY